MPPQAFDSATVLQAPRGSLAEVPLPVLLFAILLGKRTCELELTSQGKEKRIFFEEGVPVACTSNLVQETLGRYLVDKGVLTEARSLELLAVSARTGRKLGEVLINARVLDEAQLAKHLQNNLGRRILESFQWAHASYHLVGVATLPDTALKMHALQLIYVGVCTTLPLEVVKTWFSHHEQQRFARVPNPRRAWAELTLGAPDEQLVAALGSRPTLQQLGELTGVSEEALTRRLYAWSVMGFVDLTERVPENDPTLATETCPAEAAPAPVAEPFAAVGVSRRSPVRWAVGAAAVLALGLSVFAALTIFEAPQPTVLPAVPAAVVAPEPVAQARVSRPQPPLPAPPVLPPASGRAVANPPGFTLSASGIVLMPPHAGAHDGPGAASMTRGLKRLSRQKLEQALEAFSQAASEAPTDAECEYALGLTLFELGREKEALAAANSALALTPSHEMANLLAAYLELRAGLVARARARFEASLAGGSPRYAPEVEAILSQLRASTR